MSTVGAGLGGLTVDHSKFTYTKLKWTGGGATSYKGHNNSTTTQYSGEQGGYYLLRYNIHHHHHAHAQKCPAHRNTSLWSWCLMGF
jgi:hypothetical protein